MKKIKLIIIKISGKNFKSVMKSVWIGLVRLSLDFLLCYFIVTFLKDLNFFNLILLLDILVINFFFERLVFTKQKINQLIVLV